MEEALYSLEGTKPVFYMHPKMLPWAMSVHPEGDFEILLDDGSSIMASEMVRRREAEDGSDG